MTNASEKPRAETAPGRQCGACTVCCTVLPVNADGIKKTANLVCQYCDEGRGCRIYETRPAVCRQFYCEWRLNSNIAATWRPDRSGIFIQRIHRGHIEGIPPGYDCDYGVLFMLLRAEAIERPALIQTIADYVLRRVPVFLSIPGPVGYFPAQIFLNEAMESTAVKCDLTGMTAVLRQAFGALNQDKFEPCDIDLIPGET